jgi:hypothetical protein
MSRSRDSSSPLRDFTIAGKGVLGARRIHWIIFHQPQTRGQEGCASQHIGGFDGRGFKKKLPSAPLRPRIPQNCPVCRAARAAGSSACFFDGMRSERLPPSHPSSICFHRGFPRLIIDSIVSGRQLDSAQSLFQLHHLRVEFRLTYGNVPDGHHCQQVLRIHVLDGLKRKRAESGGSPVLLPLGVGSAQRSKFRFRSTASGLCRQDGALQLLRAMDLGFLRR